MSDTPDTAPAEAIVPPDVVGEPVDWTKLPAGTCLYARRIDNFRHYMPPGEFAIFCIGEDGAVYEMNDVNGYGKPKHPFKVRARIWDDEKKLHISWNARLATATEVAEAKKARLTKWLEANDAEMRALTAARTDCLREMRDAETSTQPSPKTGPGQDIRFTSTGTTI